MNRILAVTLLAAVLVASGFWLSRRQVTAAQEPQTDPAEAEGIEVPEGFDFVPYLTDERTIQFTEAEQVLEEDTDYFALLITSRGTMLLDLYEDRAPSTVNNFVFLALNRYYDGIVFHRVLEDFMAQTGDPTGTGTGGPGYSFADEIHPDLTHDAAGTLSMANSGPDTNGSQFFITFDATPWLDGRHAIFGRIAEGTELLDQLTRIDPQTPSAVALLTDGLSVLSEQGIELDGPEELTVGEHLETSLGAAPAIGQRFSLEGYEGIAGRVGGNPAVGFFPRPDRIERAAIVVRR